MSFQSSIENRKSKIQSPDYAKMSHATAISLDLMPGRMYRGAVNRCVNLLVHYDEGCSANCAYCGLAKKRPGTYEDKSFIHVDWPLFSMDQIIEAINRAPAYVKRTCISMITNGKCRTHTAEMSERLKKETSLPISILVAPTLLDREDLLAYRAAGADKIGVALDLATPERFDRYRGKGVSGPHRWETYWQTIQYGRDIFGAYHIGVHLMVGMGESEKEMITLMDRLWQMDVCSHLFSFFAEEGSRLSQRPQPPWDTYLRVQLARYVIENESVGVDQMTFDEHGRLVNPGLPSDQTDTIIRSGKPFMTTGCVGHDGEVACNRPFGNCLPDVRQWNYPYAPNAEEIDLIERNIFAKGD